MYQVTSQFDHRVKFTGLLFQCQQWIAHEGGALWHMHTVSPL